MNAVAFMHAYRFTHFSETGTRTNPETFTFIDKVGILFTGIRNPRPAHTSTPSLPHQLHTVRSKETLEGWLIPKEKALGTIIMFHGYSGEKSSLITRAEKLHELGYQLFLVDFRGSGGSTGNATTIGHSESKEVVDVFNYIEGMGETNIILFGTSMGAAAILKSLDESNIKPSAIMLECPFGQLDKTVAARFKVMGVPAFPLSDVLTFWGGLQHGYWAFSHNPEEYARAVTCPTLLMFGEKDDRVSREETDAIFANLKGEKTLAIYPEEGHALFTERNKNNWIRDVSLFLSRTNSPHYVSGSE
jgi:uncharacterized protein